jgi:hypothetical protein
MLPKKTILNNILDAAQAGNNATIRERAERLLNVEYFDLCAEYSWVALRATVQIDFSDMSDETGMWLPSHMAGIDEIRDNDDEFVYYPRDRQDIEPDENVYRFYFYNPNVEAAATVDDAVVVKGGTTFTSTDLGSTDYTDYYIKFGPELGYYLLTAAKTFTPTYNGPTQDHCFIQFRPPETRKLVTLDRSEDVMDDNTVNVYYWKYPMPLYTDEERSILPRDKILELRVLRQIPEAKARRPVSLNELRDELEKTLALNPSFPHTPPPRDRHNRMFEFDSETMYGDRNG